MIQKISKKSGVMGKQFSISVGTLRDSKGFSTRTPRRFLKDSKALLKGFPKGF